MNNENKMIIYQVFTRLFGNNNNHCVYNGDITANGCGKMADFTLKALGEVRKLGATHIWYTGIIEHATETDYRRFNIRPDHPAIVKGKAGSPYAIKDYYDVDPDLATDVPERMKEFENLVHRTHRSGLKVIIDFVPNHVARQYHSDAQPDGTTELGANDDPNYAFSPYNNFYYIPQSELRAQFDMKEGAAEPYHEYPAKATGNNRFDATPNINDWYETIKLNYGVDYLNGGTCHFSPTPDTWIKMLDILLFWASKGIDGFRCDMAEMVPVEFWEWAIPQVKEAHPEIDVELLPVTTKGDQILDRPLVEIGGKGLFIKELEVMLLEGQADLAVHSLKDMTAELADGLTLAAVTAREDPRDAFVSGKYASLDELPQLWNIARGDMAVIGPRPALWNQDDLIAERDKYGANDVKPGLTGWAQIHGRDELPIRQKAELDGYYVHHIQLKMDLECLWRTAGAVLRQDGIHEGRLEKQQMKGAKEVVKVGK